MKTIKLRYVDTRNAKSLAAWQNGSRTEIAAFGDDKDGHQQVHQFVKNTHVTNVFIERTEALSLSDLDPMIEESAPETDSAPSDNSEPSDPAPV